MVVHRHLIGGGCFSPGLFDSDKRGEMGGGSLVNSPDLHIYEMGLTGQYNALSDPYLQFSEGSKLTIFSYHFLFLEKQEP